MSVTLIMFDEQGKRRAFPLKSGTNTIGRKNDCDIRIPVSEVSRIHAEILTDEDGATVRDMGAANGTILNGQRISEEDLEPGDFLRVGPVTFIVCIDDEPRGEEIEDLRKELIAQKAKEVKASSGAARKAPDDDDEFDPIAALEALASSGDQTAIDPLDEDED